LKAPSATKTISNSPTKSASAPKWWWPELNKGIPKEPGIVPALLERVMPLQEVIHVDFYLPGCPPSAGRIKAVLEQVLAGATPQLSGKDIQFG
jgi:NAD-reducing hydrogenase small subunit